MKLKNRYSFDDEIAEKFCYDNVNRCIQIYFSGYFDFIANKHIESKCKFVICNWQQAKSKIIDREGYSSLDSNLGIISLILDAEEDGDNLKLIVNTLDDKYIELFFFSVETLVLSL